MTSPFKLQSSKLFPEHHSFVSWTPDVRKFVKSYILTDVLFAVIKCKEVGFAVKLNSGDHDSLWLDFEKWAQDKSKNYSHYLQDMYIIDGVIFKEHDKAEQFHDWLEKKYMWETLSA